MTEQNHALAYAESHQVGYLKGRQRGWHEGYEQGYVDASSDCWQPGQPTPGTTTQKTTLSGDQEVKPSTTIGYTMRPGFISKMINWMTGY